MTVTKQDMYLMRDFTKDVADHLSNINTIIEGRLSCGYCEVHDLQKYKEAVIDLFIKEMHAHILVGKFGTTTAPSLTQQDETVL